VFIFRPDLQISVSTLKRSNSSKSIEQVQDIQNRQDRISIGSLPENAQHVSLYGRIVLLEPEVTDYSGEDFRLGIRIQDETGNCPILISSIL
jgi:hypothetical protein